ncbi:ankyrin repeat domain-containing protein [Enterococcus rivorum]|uniref:Uncharacterized protein n=1 Tax=Enterococcus rivorum TaxID=762845 RepID=A0A1E5KZ31_9ENTE|nr:ankyrin repeat domain-containing protein [Enterococcus rivorum]MBP2097479.1 ankyrin repeat protein [Enterococcus rivorum]OEH82939.1 hypothetical protein BCR26_01295 [Enterococcus rivorum]
MNSLKTYLFVLGCVCLAIFFSGCADKTKPIKEETTRESLRMDSSVTKATDQDTSSIKEIVPERFSNGTLLKAVSNNDLLLVKRILQDETYSIDEVNEKNETSLLIATHQNLIEIAKALIDAGANINQQDAISDSPYLFAGAQGRTEILAYMLDKQVPDQQKFNRFGGTALIPAAEKGHLENVKLLLRDGRVNLNHQNHSGYTALIEAVALRDGSEVYQEIVKVLLENGADKTLRDNTGRSAVDYARQFGYGNMIELLQSY